MNFWDRSPSDFSLLPSAGPEVLSPFGSNLPFLILSSAAGTRLMPCQEYRFFAFLTTTSMLSRTFTMS